MQTRATRRLYGRRQPSVKDMFPMAPEDNGKRQCPLCLERAEKGVTAMTCPTCSAPRRESLELARIRATSRCGRSHAWPLNGATVVVSQERLDKPRVYHAVFRNGKEGPARATYAAAVADCHK